MRPHASTYRGLGIAQFMARRILRRNLCGDFLRHIASWSVHLERNYSTLRRTGV